MPRFTLLQLEDGEYYLEDFSILLYPSPFSSFLTPHEWSQRGKSGRLKLCTRALLFEPSSPSETISKYKFVDMTQVPKIVIYGKEKQALLITINVIWEIKDRAPYTMVKAEETLFIAFVHTEAREVLEMIVPLYAVAHERKILNKLDEEMRLAPVLMPRLPQKSFDKRYVD